MKTYLAKCLAKTSKKLLLELNVENQLDTLAPLTVASRELIYIDLLYGALFKSIRG